MMGRWRAISRVAVYALLIVSAACADTDSPTAPRVHIMPSAAVVDGLGNSFELLDGLFPNPLGNGASCDPSGQTADATPARLRSAAWIGPLGGVVTIPGGLVNGKVVAHVLTVPPFAVKGRTLFCMRLEQGNHMQVHLQAHALDWSGKVVNVGEAGFRVPVTLTMSYLSLNLRSLLEPRVVVLYDPENGDPFEKMPSVSLLLLDVVVAQLPHFSKYAMAVD